VKRGRPPKFGRPAQFVALTLPEDVIEWLHRLNADPAWAIVSLFERETRRTSRSRPPARDPEIVQLVPVAKGRSLIVVPQALSRNLPDVAAVPLGAGRAFLALAPGKGLADLELAIVDRLDAGDLAATEREPLTVLRGQLREWRRSADLSFTTRSIIIAERVAPARKRTTARRSRRIVHKK